MDRRVERLNWVVCAGWLTVGVMELVAGNPIVAAITCLMAVMFFFIARANKSLAQANKALLKANQELLETLELQQRLARRGAITAIQIEYMSAKN